MKLFEKISDQAAPPPNEQVKIFGINFYEKYYKNGKEVRKFLYNIFKIITSPTSKSFYIVGIKIFYKKYTNKQELNLLYEIIGNINFTREELKKYLHNIIQETIIDETRMANAVAYLHSKVFPQFKNCNIGKDLVIVGTGPTLNNYKFNKKLIHVGLNRAFLADNIKKLDYTFLIHYNKTSSTYIEELSKYDCIKFFGQYHFKDILDWNIPNIYANAKNIYRYFIDRTLLHPNIEVEGLYDPGSIAFSALHFSLYTHPKRIFLVGCDCTQNGYYDNSVEQVKWLGLANTLKSYPILKNFAQIYYPDIEIISVNPIGLRGIFRDVYTKSYVTDNPELFIGLEDKIKYFEDIV